MPQPDSGDNCCDCPSRTSPCDDCGGAGCTTCPGFVDSGSGCTDADGNCHPIENCDGTCSGPITPCVDIRWMTDIAYCTTVGEGCSIQSVHCVTSVNRVTCEFTQVGDCFGDCPDGQTVINSEEVRWEPCSTCSGIECGACCVGEGCYTMSATECFDFFGLGATFYAGLSCDGFFCPI